MSIPENPKTHIVIRGARVNNLQNLDVSIPRNSLTVISGLSGSGKSSLAFDTLYAEGQRRFVESLSAYARQFLDRMNKPDVDSISGLPPAVAIEQRVFARNPRSTVGTTTEIYDYLRLLYGRIGTVVDKDTGEIIRKDTPESVCSCLVQDHLGKKLYILVPVTTINLGSAKQKELLIAGGYTRIVFGETAEIADIEEWDEERNSEETVFLLIDRLIPGNDSDSISRVTESLETAFRFGNGKCMVRVLTANGDHTQISDHFYSTRFENAKTGTVYVEPEPRLFSFNNPYGACPVCQGFGRSVGIDENLVFPDKQLTIRRGAIQPFRGDAFSVHLRTLLSVAAREGIPVDVPVNELTPEQYSKVMDGAGSYIGVLGFFKMLEEKSYKTHYRVMLSRFRGYTKCRACGGSRLRTAARQVYIGGLSIPDVVKLTLEEARKHFDSLAVTPYQREIVGLVLEELQRRLTLLCDIGLEYLTLDRLTHTLSGGESQRINLATSLGSSLVGTLYVLDEPSIGLHQRDTAKLVSILYRMRDLGNTVVVVEHDPDIIRSADHIIDIGPGAGEHGGKVVFQGSYAQLLNSDTLTSDYLTGKKTTRAKRSVRKGSGKKIIVRQPRHNNLKADLIELPLGKLTVVTGVSGSGKSSLVNNVIYNGIRRVFGGTTGEVGKVSGIEGLAEIVGIEMVDQSPIGRSSRSTPATYTKVFDHIRETFAATQISRQLGWRAGHFSFNVAGGRCEVCQGEGRVTIEMQFLPDIELPCEACNGTRYKKEVLQVLYKGKSIIDVLNMTVNEALQHFSDVPKVVHRLTILRDVGLGYIKLGQPATHLSGGEAQRLKLASFLDVSHSGHTLFVFDEPTTGLHLHDISFLLSAFDALVDSGNTVVIVEHNLNVIAAADHIIDLGPEGGVHGGRVVATGTPKQVAKVTGSYTGQALRAYYSASTVQSAV